MQSNNTMVQSYPSSFPQRGGNVSHVWGDYQMNLQVPTTHDHGAQQQEEQQQQMPQEPENCHFPQRLPPMAQATHVNSTTLGSHYLHHVPSHAIASSRKMLTPFTGSRVSFLKEESKEEIEEANQPMERLSISDLREREAQMEADLPPRGDGDYVNDWVTVTTARGSLIQMLQEKDVCGFPPMEVMWKYTHGDVNNEVPRYREMTLAEHNQKLEIMRGNYKEDMIRRTEDVPKNERTTVMMRNLPKECTRQHILDILYRYDYGELLDFLYLPIDFQSKRNMGYCFINFINPQEAMEFKKLFVGFNEWMIEGVESDRKSDVAWREPYQGLAALIKQYRSSPVMHEVVPDEYKPCLYRNGERIPFPKPLKAVTPPKLRRQLRVSLQEKA